MKRPIAETYIRVTRGLSKNPEISMRKQVCVAYLLWSVRKRKEDLRKFVEITVNWRKTEGKVGYCRTKLEKIARRLFPEIKKQKRSARFTENSKEIGERNLKQGRGWCAPEKLKGGRERMLRARAMGDKNGTRTTGAWWIIFPPEGEPFKIRNLTAFCRENGLSPHDMKNTANNPAKGRHHKGWRAEHWDPIWDKVHNEDNPT